MRLYDCSRITADKIEQIAYITPNLSTLQLSYCGRLIDPTLAQIVSRLHSLQHLILTGPFLITTKVWKSTLETIGHRLLTFEISDTARWDEGCTEALVTQCPNLENVALKRINGLSNEIIAPLATLKHLKSLDLSDPQGTITDDCVIPILLNTGPKLEKLILDSCVELSDETFSAIITHCPNLHILSLAGLERLTNECVTTGFEAWNQNAGLTSLSFCRCVGVKDAGVQALLVHSGASLESLNLNSLDELTQETLSAFWDEEGNVGNELIELDLGFVRCINDDVIRALSMGCRDLKILKVTPFVLKLFDR